MKTKTITLKSKNASNQLEACEKCDLYHLCYNNMIDCELGFNEYWEVSEIKVQESSKQQRV